MEKDTSLLSRVTANHLFLSQFEAFRATILSLRRRNPELALSILQTIVANGGKIDNIIYSPNCSSPALLTWLCSLELFQFDNATSIWSLSPDVLKLRVEFLLYIQMISSRVSDRIKIVIDTNRTEDSESCDDARDSVDEYNNSSHVLDKLMELGFRRLKEDLIIDDYRECGEVSDRENVEGDDLVGLRKVILDNADVFDALCVIIQKELGELAPDESGMAISLKTVRRTASQDNDMKMLMELQKSVQMVHLDAMKVDVRENDIDKAVWHICYLHLDYVVQEAEYRVVFQDLLRKVLSGKEGFGDSWLAKREKLLLIYQEALSSSCMSIVQMIQAIQDEFLAEEIETLRTTSNQNLPPLDRFQNYVEKLECDVSINKDFPSVDSVVSYCMKDLYHYARVGGLHVLECIMDASLSAVKEEDLERASSLLLLFPRLQPLVAAMGWDLLHGKTEARRKMMKLLWTSKSQVYQLEESSLYENQSDEKSSVEHLCDTLCYQLDLASFVACVNSGQAWDLKSSLFFSRQEQVQVRDDCTTLDPFVENFVLERLSFQSPLRVLFDVAPNINFEDAIKLISMQPIASTAAAWKKMQDIELMHMRYALECAALALGAMEKGGSDDIENNHQKAVCFLKKLRHHLEAINNIPRKIYLVNIIVSLLHIDEIAVNFTQGSHMKWSTTFMGDKECISFDEGGTKSVVSFMELLLGILHRNLPSDHELEESDVDIGRQALDWRSSSARSFIRDWEWRLSMLQQLFPLTERKWRWKEALTVLRAAPSKLLNLCLQRAKYKMGKEAVHRFSLPPEDKATLALAEWVDGTFERAYVDDTLSRASEGRASIQEIDFISLRSQIGPLATIFLCVDVAAASARSSDMAQQLLDQAQVMLSEIYPGVSPKIGPMYWDQIREVALISVARRLLKRLHELLENGNDLRVKDNPPALQAVISGDITAALPNRQGQRDRALAMLHQMIEDAHQGKRQFLSGKLHNLARAVADEEMGTYFMKDNGTYMERKSLLEFDKEGVIGTGLRAAKQASSTPATAENIVQPATYDVKDTGKRLFAPLSPKPSTYLSQFILHIAAIGDIVDGADTTHDFNYFSLIYEWPKDLVTRLVFEQGSTDAAEKVAEIMSTDFVHEVISACVPPVYPPRLGQGWASIPLPSSSSKSNAGNKFSLSSANESARAISHYSLQLDIVKHLVKSSPVRAVLGSVFGGSMLYNKSESFVSGSLHNEMLHSPDADRLFYEFALDQSERFPTLNRWIQMQTNLHRVSAFSVTSTDSGDDVVKAESRSVIKRACEHDSDTESEVDANSFGDTLTTFSEANLHSGAGCDPVHESLNYSTPSDDQMVFVTFDWENEEPYEKAVDRLIEEGNLMDALALSDRFLRNGASDHLLELLIESSEDHCSNSDHSSGHEGENIWSKTWQYCLRLKNKQLAAKLALRYLHNWQLAAALDVLTMCSCHLSHNDPMKNEVLQRRQALQRYKRILCSDNHYMSWQEVEAAFKEDPEGLALKLAEKGAVSAALEVAESAGLSIDLRRELQGRQLVKLLTEDPLNRGGPAEASRFLASLPDADDALPVVMGAMQLLPNLRSKQLLVHFFLKRKDGNLSAAEVSRLNLWALGLRVLSSLPLPWQQRCSSLHEHPQLIVEVLLMRKQLESASLILKAFPSLRDDEMLLTYAAKAIVVSVNAPSRESRISVSGARLKQKMRPGTPTKSSFTSSLNNLQKEARRAFSWAPRNTGDKTILRETVKKRKSSGLMAPEKNAFESMTGIQEDGVSLYSGDAEERLPSVSIAEEWMLTGVPSKDDAVRAAHRYDSAPDIILFKAILSLCSDESVSAKGAMELCVNQMKGNLNSQQLPHNASVETIGRAYLATETFVQGLLYARSLLRKLSGSTDLSCSSERMRDVDDTSSDAGSSNVGSQATDELTNLLSQTDIWLRRAELLQSLLGSGIAASLDDIADQESSARLRDRLIAEERYSMAVYTCKKCKIGVFPVWIAWGHALLRIEHYDQARVKFKQALQLHKNDIGGVILDIVNTIENSPPVDVSAARCMYEHLAKSAPTILDDSLSADSYLNVLHMPSTLPRSERSRWFPMSANDGSMSNSGFEDGPRSNLDSVRYLECVNYFQEYAREHLLGFMFRHGYYKEACMLFFPSNGVPAPPQPSVSGAVTSSSSPQRPDPLATDYGTIDELCELCVGYGAMAVLEELISSRMSPETSKDASVSQHTAAAIARICNYCETHRHFNYLYNFLVIKQDHVAAGLCCIQLFMNSTSQEDAVKHLEHAKMHFDEGLSARHKPGQGTKLITKSIRGKSASEKLTAEGLLKLSARVDMQVDVVKSLNLPEGPQWKYSLFGNPSDPETFRRRCQIAETLSDKNFDLAFRVIYEFHLPAVDIYAAIAASLAERKKGGQLTEFFKNIKGTIEDDDMDQVLGAAINVYANKHKERPDRLIDMLTSSHRKVLACVICGRLKSAFQIASRSGSVADVQYVAHQALHANALPVLDMCKQWLAQYM